MAKKLQNIRAIRQMLDGSHRTQNKTSVGYEATKETHEVGDVWVDGNGVEWEQFKGFKSNTTKALDAIRAALKELKMPEVCPKCSNEMKDNKYNRKMWSVHKMCFDCVIDMEHEHRLNGTFDEYARNLMKPNIESWLKDARSEMKAIQEMLTKAEFVNSDGTIEKWETPWQGREEELSKLMEEDFQRMSAQLLGEEQNEISNIN